MTAATTRSTGKANRFGGRCVGCNAWVEPEDGHLVRDDDAGRWGVRCEGCEYEAREARWERRYTPPPPRDDLPPGWQADPVIQARLRELRALANRPPFARVLDIPWPTSKDEIRLAYRRRALETHPDRGGSAAAFREVQSAFEEASRLVGGRL